MGEKSGPGAIEVGPSERGLYVISTAAELAGMHPQTLRTYERRGLIRPKRTSGNIRRYSDADIRRLRRIHELTEAGLNLSGVEMIIELEDQVSMLKARLERMAEEMAALERRASARVEAVHKSYRRELVRRTPDRADIREPRRQA